MRWLSLATLGLLSCAHTLSEDQRASLAQDVERYGTRVYLGTVTPSGRTAPAFRYERRVLDLDDGTRISTHVTWSLADLATPILVQRATQDAAGHLLAYDEVHGQRATSVHLGAADVVVGPTLFETVRRRLPDLREGRTVPISFWSDGTSYDFRLRLVTPDTVELRATDFLVGLAVAPMRLVLGAKDEVVSYHGRVPPLLDGHPVDADVTYERHGDFR